MCYIWKHPSIEKDEIKPEVMARLPNDMGRINITGGEPMIRDDIGEIVDVLYPKTEVLEISTNGFYTDKIVQIARKYPDVLIRVSTEGLPSVNDRLRGTPDGFDHALRTILELKRAGAKNIGFGIVICDKNAMELLYLYELCCYLGIEFGNATMHNSWYFHKLDNVIEDRAKTVEWEKRYIKALLTSPRTRIPARTKDWLRAYFNKSILRMIAGEQGFRPPCVAGTDMFFLDPWGNILPCNGTDERWIMGSLKEEPFEQIWHSKKAQTIRAQVQQCQKTCCFVATERFDMVRRPWRPILWILRNKIRLMLDKEMDF
jgi:MoaA/NifB/PqqE/SkfB family radical SAM enzyme